MEFPLLLPQDSLGLFSPPLFMSGRFLQKKGGGECNVTERVRDRSRFVTSVYMRFGSYLP